ncbi:SDR family NAD(P)-dependent oxidoreductase [Microbacterium alcoholitolerans]|uniref:SDR family NAD(P)-dependent oxidoreductase n=1 Tax=unclassified Microbacterium TaxID=2609290 RepID=UPI003D1770E7
MHDISLQGQVAVVTGAGGGLGRSYALALADAGAAVLVNDTGGALDGQGGERGAAHAVVDEIVARGGHAAANTDSVATPEGGEAIVAHAIAELGDIDIVVNNAGILRDRSVGKIDWNDFQSVHDVHLRGSAHVSQPAFRHMREKGYGRFVFIGSNAGTFGNFGQAAYASAKGGIMSLSGIVAIEGERHGILSNVVCPIARTRMTDSMLDDALDLDPDHVSPLIVYLSSRENTATHQIFSAGGGHFSRVFLGLTDGWFADEKSTAGAIAEHFDDIVSTGHFSVPGSAAEEVAALAARIAESTSGSEARR